jgi:hypothetical protein
MSAMMIGCADTYDAMIVRQPGNMTGQGITPEPAGTLTEVVSVAWGRVRKRAAECTVTVTKCPSNCEFLTSSSNWTGVDPWAHEIWLYRDRNLAFQGPVVSIRETRDAFIIVARDMVQWLYAREIREYYSQTYTAPGVASSLINTFFPPDDPDLIRHKVTFPNTTGDISVEYDHAQYTIGQKFDELVSAGLDFTTMGRAIYLMGNIPPNYFEPFLIDADHIIGEIEIDKNGLDYGNHIVGLGEGLAYGVGPSAADRSYYGKVTYPPNRFNDVKILSQLQAVTNTLYNTKRALTPRLVIPAGSTLSPDTVVYNEGWQMNTEQLRLAFSHLIPGFRYDVRVGEEFCDPAAYPMVLSEVAVTWTAEGKGEKVAVSFDNMAAGDDNGES